MYSEALKKGLKMATKPPVIEYHKSFCCPGSWGLERGVAEELQQKIEEFNLPLELNLLTSGNNSCLMIAILQGLQHEDLKPHISEEVLIKATRYDTRWLRNSVSQFIQNSKHPKVQDMKSFYERNDLPFQTRKVSWEELWSDSPHGMRNPDKWGDQNFLQAAAYFLNIKIKVLDTSLQRIAENQSMYTTYLGNLDKDPEGPPIYLGLRNGCHFQALIPVGTISEIEPEASNEVIDLEDEDHRDGLKDEAKNLDHSDASMEDEATEIFKEAELIQDDKLPDSDVSMLDKSMDTLKDSMDSEKDEVVYRNF